MSEEPKNGMYKGLSGHVTWYRNGVLHREDGPAVEWTNGTRSWYLNGLRHREDGPAVMGSDGSGSWYLHGKRHREDGPAVTWSSGQVGWYLNGVSYTEEEHAREVAKLRAARLSTPEARRAKLEEIRDRLEHAFREDV